MHIFQKSDHISPRFEKNKIEQAPPPDPSLSIKRLLQISAPGATFRSNGTWQKVWKRNLTFIC